MITHRNNRAIRFCRQIGNYLSLRTVVQGSWTGLLGVLISVLVLSQSALAETKEISQTVTSYPGQAFKDLMQQAEALAANLIQQAFVENPAVTQVTVKVAGERTGQEAPLLFASVSRADWERDPRVQTWTTYFNHSSVYLLGFRSTQPAQSAQSSTPGVYAPGIAPPAIGAPGSSAGQPYRRAKPISEDDPAYRDD